MADGEVINQNDNVVDHKLILEEYWQNGMTSYGSSRNNERVAEIVKKTGMSAKKVKCWIKSRNRMETRRRFGRTKAPSVHARKKSAYCTFLSEYMAKEANKSQQSRKDLLKSAGEAWRKIKASKTSLNNYNLAASKKNANNKKLSQHQMKPWQNKVVKEMQVLCEKLEEQNCEAFVAVVNSDGELITAGTDMAKNFMQREDLFLQRFGLAVSGKEQFACKSKDSWDDLRCKVQEIFNEKFCALTGERRMSYKKIAAGEVSVCGLPPGVSFNRPSSYGLEDLQAIVQNSSKIYCEVMEMVDAPISEELQEDNQPQTSEPEEEMERVNAPIPEELPDEIAPETTVFRILQPIYQDLTS